MVVMFVCLCVYVVLCHCLFDWCCCREEEGLPNGGGEEGLL